MSKFRNIKVKKAGGGYRMQRAKVLSSGKLKFVKNARRRSRRRKAVTHRRHRRATVHVAKRRRRRSHHRRHRRSHRRRHHGGGMYFGIIPKSDAHDALAALAWGKVESIAKADPNFILNKLPKFIDGLGWTGNTAMDLYIVDRFLFSHPMLRRAAKAGLDIAAYQIGRLGKAFDKSDQYFAISGADYMEHDAAFMHEHAMGALDVEAGVPVPRGADIAGLPFEDEVYEAAAHT